MLSISHEQQQIVNSIKEGNNVIVNATPGSGKTTTLLFICLDNLDKNVLILTYNKKLKYETMKRIKDYNIKNCNVYNYHSYCNTFYDKCYNDTDIEFIFTKRINKNKAPSIDILLIDEAQDINPLYYELICKIYLNNIKKYKKYCQIGIIGDSNQCIFNYNGSSPNYMFLAKELFNFNTYKWETFKLNNSFRLTCEMVNIINNYFIHNNINNEIQSINNIENSMYYIICNMFDVVYLYSLIQENIKNYNFNDILILSPSIKNDSSPAKLLANYLSNNKYPVFIPSSDNDYIYDNIINDKITFLTFHQSKGLERKIVYVLGFDNAYSEKIKKDMQTCPEILYVAISRASEKLYLIHHQNNEFCNFIHPDFIKNIDKLKNIKFINKSTNKNITKYINKENTHYSITSFIKYIPSHIMNDFLNNIKIKIIHRKSDKINLNSITLQKNEYNESELELEESIKNITGILIPFYFEYTIKQNIEDTQIYKFLESQKIKHKNYIKEQIIDIYMKHIEEKNKDTSFFLKLSNIYSSYILNSINTLNQIKNYDWIDITILEQTNTRLKKILLPKYKNKYVFEYNIYNKFNNKFTFYGSIDCVDYNKKIIHEFKCCENIIPEHYLQLALYGYMFINMPKFLLINNVVYLNYCSNIIECIITYYDKDTVHLSQKNKNYNLVLSSEEFIKNVINVSHPILKEKLLSNDKDFKLYITNILTSETKEIIIDYDYMYKLINDIINSRYYQYINEDIDIFKKKNLAIYKKYFKY